MQPHVFRCVTAEFSASVGASEIEAELEKGCDVWWLSFCVPLISKGWERLILISLHGGDCREQFLSVVSLSKTGLPTLCGLKDSQYQHLTIR